MANLYLMSPSSTQIADHSSMNRRKFLKTGIAAAIGMPLILPSRVLGRDGHVAPSNQIVVGGIGLGPRGRQVLREGFLKQKDVRFVAIADPRADNRETIRRIVNGAYGNEDCHSCPDMFEIHGRSDIDAVLIATGNRWHGLASMLAAHAGKDVYCEKPVSMSVRESLDLAHHVNASGRSYQAGMQRRSVENFQFAVGLARSGKLGRLRSVHAGLVRRPLLSEPLPEEPLPDPSACDWDRWVGPSPTRPYNRKYLLGNWRDYQDFVGLTSLPEWGSHTIDLCQWAADMDAGGPVQFECEGDTIYGTYPNGVRLVMRTAGFKGEGDWKVSGTCPVRFEGDEGWVEADDKRDLVASDPRLLEGAPTEGASGTTPTRHVREFLDCVKSRKTTSGNASIAGNTHVVCHAASIAWTLARPLAFDPKKGVFPGDEEATRLCDWKYRDPWKLPS
jgi:predicted dehydrogenase